MFSRLEFSEDYMDWLGKLSWNTGILGNCKRRCQDPVPDEEKVQLKQEVASNVKGSVTGGKLEMY